MADTLLEIKLDRLRRLRELQQRKQDVDNGDGHKKSWRETARPDQLEPEGDWFVWLILAGRGWGKSRTAAELMAEKARRYPGCRVALVARTIGDTRDTMIEGDSGLLNCFKQAELRGGKINGAWNRSLGELYLENGSKFFTYSAEKPWQLRGPQFHFCFPAGTLVRVHAEAVPIETLKVGDEVLTRQGLRRVTMTSSRVDELITVTHGDGQRLTGTPDHPVMVWGRGWTRLDAVRPGDRLFTWADEFHRARSMSSASSGSRTFTVTGIGMSWTRARATASSTSASTARSGSGTTANCQPVSLFTTSTATPATTASRTSKPSPLASTATFTVSRPRSSSAENAAPMLSLASRDDRGSTVSRAASDEHATTAAGDGSKSSSASTAARTSRRGSPPRAVELVGSVVSAVSTVGLVGRVFNLEVEDQHEFFADDVLVHNCWADEACFWADAHKGTAADTTWSNLTIATRLPRRPDWPLDYVSRIVVATTPRPVALLRVSDTNLATPGLMQRDNVIVTRGRTVDNLENLSDSYKANVIAPMLGTQLGLQELDAEILENRDNALWKREWLEADRLPVDRRKDLDLIRVVIGIDPAVTSGEASDLTGIVVCGADREGHGYVLADYTMRGTPQQCMRRVKDAYDEFEADRAVAEVNNGGDYIGTVLKTIDDNIPFRAVRASRGKNTRAEPVSALYEQHRVHHVGMFPQLEDEMCTWAPGDPESPDRMDALVWAMYDLKDLIGGSWLDAYGVVKCQACERPFTKTNGGVPRDKCPYCNAPIEEAA